MRRKYGLSGRASKNMYETFYFLKYIFILCFLSPTVKKVRKDLAYALQFPAFDHHFNNYIHHFVFYFIEEYNLLIFPRYCYSFISVDDSDFNQNPLSFRVLKF